MNGLIIQAFVVIASGKEIVEKLMGLVKINNTIKN